MKTTLLFLFIACLSLSGSFYTQVSHSAGNNRAGGRVIFYGSVTEAACVMRMQDTIQLPLLDCSKRSDVQHTETQRLAEITIRYLGTDKKKAIIMINHH